MKSKRDPAKVLLISTVPSTLWAFYRRMPEVASRYEMEIAVASSADQELSYFQEQCGIVTHALPMPRRITPVRDLRSMASLIRIIRNNRYDIVHAFTTKAGLVGMAAARLAGVRHRIYSMLGLPAETATGLTRTLLVASERVACRSAEVALACSHSLKSTIEGLEICTAPKLRVLADGTCCGVNARRFSRTPEVIEAGQQKRRALQIPVDALVLGFVGRLVYDKGIHTIVDAFDQLAKRWPNLYLLLLGGFEPHRGRVPAGTIEQIEQHPRIKHVAFDWDPVPYYTIMDVVALATLREGFPYVLLEAAAMEIPAVATRATGCVDAIVDGETGLFTEIGDSAGMARAIEKLLRDPTLRSTIGRAARRRVEARFTDDRLLDEHFKLYTSLLGAELLTKTDH